MSYQLELLGRALGMLKEHEFDNYYGHDDDGTVRLVAQMATVS